MTICLAARGVCGGGVFRSRFTCRVFGRASILASPSLERRRMTKMPPDGYPALQYLHSVRVSKRQARSNTGFPGNHHARLEFGLITCLDSSWPLSFVLAPISMTAWIWDQADHRPVLRSQACAGLRDWRDLCLYLPVQHHQDCAVCSWPRQRNPHQPSLLLIIQRRIHIYYIYKL